VIGKLLDNFKNHSEKYRFIVIDNNSSDDIEQLINEKYPFIELYVQDKNLGFGRANNVGLEMVDTRYAMILNPDIDISPETIEALIKTFGEFENAVAVAPATRRELFQELADGQPVYSKVDWVVGAAMLFDMKKLREIGFFDENFFLYYEETDLCKRIIDQGKEIILVKSLFADHDEGTSSAPCKKIEYLKGWHLSWSKMYFKDKHSNKVSLYRKNLSFLLKFIMKYCLYIILFNKKKSNKYRARLDGAWSYLIGQKAFNENCEPRGFKSR
jgi:GT2 family glycosyltransferase